MKINNNIIKIAKKEINGYLNNPSSYIVVALFLFLWEFLFFKSVFLINEVSLRSLYGVFPWLMLILIPAITMGSISKEKDDGTIELALTHPISELDFILGKFLGSFVFTIVVLMFVLPIAYLFSVHGDFDWGLFAGQFIGSILFSASFIALGIFASGLVSSQIASLLLSAVMGFFFIVVGTEFFTVSVPFEVGAVFERLSILSHMNSISRGVLDLRDIWYFLTFIAIFLSLAYLQLLKSKYGNKRIKYLKYQTAVILFIGIAILTNVIGNRIPGRLDLTQDRVYTLSRASKDTLADLDDIVTVNVYVSDKLPAQYSPVLRETKDLLRDYKNSSKGKVEIYYKDPTEDAETASEAQSFGVQEIQFNVIGQDDFQIKNGYLGLVVSYAGESEVIPFIQDTTDLEYQLTSMLQRLTITEKETIAFIDGVGEKSLITHYSNLRQALSTQFNVVTLNVDPEPLVENEEVIENQFSIDPTIAAVILAGPNNTNVNKVESALNEYVSQGGSVLLMLDAYSVDTSAQSISVNENNFSRYIGLFGLKVNSDVVYDLRSNQTLQISGGIFGYLLPYPFWVRAIPSTQDSTITSKLSNIIVPWGSTLTPEMGVLESLGFEYTPLLSTTPFAGVKTGSVTIDPQQNFDQSNLGEKVLAAQLTNSETGGRFVVIGDSDLLTDDFTSNDPQNLVFGMNALSWLAQEASLGEIKIKDRTSPSFVFSDSKTSTNIKLTSLGISLLTPTIYGFYRLMYRRSYSRRKYKQ